MSLYRCVVMSSSMNQALLHIFYECHDLCCIFYRNGALFPHFWKWGFKPPLPLLYLLPWIISLTTGKKSHYQVMGPEWTWTLKRSKNMTTFEFIRCRHAFLLHFTPFWKFFTNHWPIVPVEVMASHIFDPISCYRDAHLLFFHLLHLAPKSCEDDINVQFIKISQK